MNKIILGSLVSLLAVLVATPAFAYEATEQDQLKNVDRLKAETRESIRNQREATTQTRDSVVTVVDSQDEIIAERRAELKEKIQALRAERKEKLVSKRLEICERRQARINQLTKKSSEIGQNRLEHIQNIEKRVLEFYKKMQLDIAEYESTLAVVDEKEAAALAALETAKSLTFDCDTVDGANPSGEIKLIHATKKQALTDYRDALKQLFQLIKTSVGENKERSAS